MSIRRTMEESTFVHLEPGTYPVTCMSVRADTLENPQFGNGDVIRFTLRVDDLMDENGKEVERDLIANDKLTPMSKLTECLMAFGVRAEVGEELDLEECVGHKALAQVSERKKDDKVYDRIEKLLPQQRMAAADPAGNISDFWKVVKNKGYTVPQVTQTAEDMYGKHPKDLSADERQEILETI